MKRTLSASLGEKRRKTVFMTAVFEIFERQRFVRLVHSRGTTQPNLKKQKTYCRLSVNA
jgi:hypothetical protein